MTAWGQAAGVTPLPHQCDAAGRSLHCSACRCQVAADPLKVNFGGNWAEGLGPPFAAATLGAARHIDKQVIRKSST